MIEQVCFNYILTNPLKITKVYKLYLEIGLNFILLIKHSGPRSIMSTLAVSQSAVFKLVFTLLVVIRSLHVALTLIIGDLTKKLGKPKKQAGVKGWGVWVQFQFILKLSLIGA